MKFKTIQSQIIVTFVTIIIGIQLIGLIPLERSINENAYRSAEQDLKVGEGVFKNILEQNTANLKQGAKILAADYGFRASAASNDSQTIISALNNHQDRISADIAIFYSKSTDDTIVSGSLSKVDARNALNYLIATYDSESTALDFEIFNGIPYQLVAVPVKAPLVIGWVVMGFKIDNTLAIKLQKITNLQVTFIQKTERNQWAAAGSTLSNHQSELLVSSFVNNYQHKNQDHKLEIQIEDELYDTSAIFLHKNKKLIVAVLQQSLTEATASYASLKNNLIIIVIIGLIIFTIATIWLSKYITAPIKAISNTAKQLEIGNYDIEVKTNRQDEIGVLSQSFNSMREAIALREKEVTRLAFWDEITGLKNRVAFAYDVKKAIEQHDQSTFAVLVFNIDRFKVINKILGRKFGDKVLKIVGQKLLNGIRKSSDLVARIGADEYGLLLTDATIEDGFLIAKNILSIFDQPLTVKGQKIDIRMSVGIAVYPEHGKHNETLLNHAETALQVSKVKKSGIVLYDSIFEKEAEANLTLSTELKKAVIENEFLLFLQPKVNISNKAVDAAEALIRWQHPERGMVFPDQFIPFAEEVGVVPLITHWMLKQACRAHVALKKKGVPLQIAVNISTRDLIDQELPNTIKRLFFEHKVGPEAISLEITESSVMDDPVLSEQTLIKLADMGLKISIDDYGTGYSSLTYLKKLPVEELKIDKSFVLKVDQNEHDATIVRSTIDLGHNLNLKVVAEGIENEASWQMLSQMGCDIGQGYFMAKPMSADDFEAWHINWHRTPEKIKTA
ncbi:MAG: EAL domain-containing protein [Methylophilaceae bacterium]